MHGLGSAGVEHTLEGCAYEVDGLQCERQRKAEKAHFGAVEIECKP